jgi:chitin disaccharide deacetylase
MTTRPSWPVGAREACQYKDRAEIGLHLNLTLGSPLGRMPAFAASRRFPEIARIVKAGLRRKLPQTEIGPEISRQIDEFCDHFGAPPAFIDGHQHVHLVPQIRTELFASLEAKGLAGKVWLRNASDHISRILRRRSEVAKSLSLAWLGRGFAAEAAARGFITNDGFAGFSAFRPERDYGLDFARYLRAPGNRHLVMCHPGYCDAELIAADPVTASREQELSFLLSPTFLETLDRFGARLARLSDAGLWTNTAPLRGWRTRA